MAAPTAKRQKKINIAAWLPAITVVVGLGVAIAGYFVLLVPKIGPLMAGGKYDFAPLKKRVAEDKDYAEKMKASLVAFEQLSTDKKDQVKAMMPSDADFPNLMVSLDALASRHSMMMMSLDAVTDDKGMSAVGRKPVRLSINITGGDYPTLKSFLSELERSLRLIDATSVNFSPGGGFGLSLRTYFLDVKAVEAAAKAAAKTAAAPAPAP